MEIIFLLSFELKSLLCISEYPSYWHLINSQCLGKWGCYGVTPLKSFYLSDIFSEVCFPQPLVQASSSWFLTHWIPQSDSLLVSGFAYCSLLISLFNSLELSISILYSPSFHYLRKKIIPVLLRDKFSLLKLPKAINLTEVLLTIKHFFPQQLHFV